MLVTGMAPAGVSAAGTQSSKTRTKKTSAKPAVVKKAKAKKRRPSRRNRGQKAPTAGRVTEIQQALSREGAYSGEPTGKWDAGTIAAMKRFQVSQGLNPSGRLEALSLHKLGLGAGTAGIAAPLPPLDSPVKTGTPDK